MSKINGEVETDIPGKRIGDGRGKSELGCLSLLMLVVCTAVMFMLLSFKVFKKHRLSKAYCLDMGS